MIYGVKTIVGRENMVIDLIASRVKSKGLKILSLMHPEEIKGYIFIEGELEDVEKAIRDVPHVRGLIRKPVKIEELQRFLQPKTVEIDLKKDDLVEVIGGPFKGEKGKVVRYDKVKREVTIELVEAVVPIPVTVSVELVKLVKKGEG